MTLITAWITPEFRIIASDSKVVSHVAAENKKIYITENAAIGIYGELSNKQRVQLTDYVKAWPKADSYDLSKLIRSKDFNSPIYETTHLVVIHKTDQSPLIITKQKNGEVIEQDIISYKSRFQKYLPPELFFSEIKNSKQEVDFNYQKCLLDRFKQLNIEQEKNQINTKYEGLSPELQLIIEFYRHITRKENECYQEKVGGSKIYYTYSYESKDWAEGVYPAPEPPVADADLMSLFS